MQNMDCKNKDTTIDVAYIEQICYEFSRLLYDLSEEHKREYSDLEYKYLALEKKCQEYEQAILQGDNQQNKVIVKKRFFLSELKNQVKHLFLIVSCWFFSCGRCIATHLGIKEKLKQTKLFQKLYMQGFIDKLRK